MWQSVAKHVKGPPTDRLISTRDRIWARRRHSTVHATAYKKAAVYIKLCRNIEISDRQIPVHRLGVTLIRRQFTGFLSFLLPFLAHLRQVVTVPRAIVPLGF